MRRLRACPVAPLLRRIMAMEIGGRIARRANAGAALGAQMWIDRLENPPAG